MSDKTPEQIEIDSLRQSNADLLAEAKAAKTARRDLETQVETLTRERDEARATVDEVQVRQPVGELLARISTAPDVLQIMMDKHGYSFARGEGGGLVFLKGGEPIEFKGRKALFTAEDVTEVLVEHGIEWGKRSETAKSFAALIKASDTTGGGAPQSRQSPPPAAPPAASTPAPSLGLR